MTATRDRGYAVQKQIPLGARVRITQEFMHYEKRPAGLTGVVWSFSNAGFRGIEATVVLDDPILVNGEERRCVPNISAGILQLIGGPHDAAVAELERSGWTVSRRRWTDGGTMMRRDYLDEMVLVEVSSLGEVGEPFTLATRRAAVDLSRLHIQRTSR